MNRSIKQKLKQNIIVISIIITIVFLIINISLYIINNNYLINKVEEENNAFLQITTHIMNENELEVALEYVEHYTHIHEVNIEIMNEDDQMVFSSNLSHRYTTKYTIETMKGTFTVFMDNTDSITVNRVETNTLYVNAALIIIYLFSLGILFKLNKTNSNQMNMDIQNILDLMKKQESSSFTFHHTEFEDIYHAITRYLENIDMLTEQKDMNVKGLAHDIKTPLTIVYSYFERVHKNEIISEEERQIAFESSKRINSLLNDLIENKTQITPSRTNVSEILSDKVKQHVTIFKVKNITIVDAIERDIYITLNARDISRIFDNIISNAYYYSKNDSQFIVTVERKEKVYITFQSTPTHPNTIDVDAMFQKGYRGQESSNTNTYGKGYGLYLCKILLHQIGGTIQVNKEEENVKFTIIL